MIQQKLSENHTSKSEGSGKGTLPGKMYDSPKGMGKGKGKKSKFSVTVSIPLVSLHNPPPPPQPQPAVSLFAPGSQAAVSFLASQAVSSVISGTSSASGTGAKSKVLLIECTQCSYKTYQRGDFNLHMDKHRGIRYRCSHPGCKKDFGSEKAKNQHIRTNHFAKPRSMCPFPDCDFSHNDHGVTKVHLYTDHGVGKEPKCRHPDCKDRDLFTNYMVFERHIKNYHKARDEKCPHCDKKYKGIDNLRLHIGTAHKKKSQYSVINVESFMPPAKV